MIGKTTRAAAFIGLLLSAFAARIQASDTTARKQAESIFAATGIRGGLVVHLGC